MERKDSDDLRQLKYRELAEHSREMLFQQQERFARVDSKAAAHLSALTVLFAVVGYFLKWMYASVVPPKLWIDWAIVGLGAIAIISVTIAWVAFYSVLRHHKIEFLRFDREYIEFCRRNLRVDVNFQMAVRSAQALESLTSSTHRKAGLIGRGYSATLVCMAAIVLLSAVYAAREWNARADDLTATTTREHVMSNDQNQSASTPTSNTGGGDSSRMGPNADSSSGRDTEPSSASEPDPSVTGPSNVYLTEGVDISNISRKSNADSTGEAPAGKNE